MKLIPFICFALFMLGCVSEPPPVAEAPPVRMPRSIIVAGKDNVIPAENMPSNVLHQPAMSMRD